MELTTRAQMRALRKVHREAGLCHCGNHLLPDRRTCTECQVGYRTKSDPNHRHTARR